MEIDTDIKNTPTEPQPEVKTPSSGVTVSDSVRSRADTSESDGRQDKTWRDNLNIGIALIGLFIIGFQAWIMYRQTGIMRTQTNIMDHSLRVSERAYVGIASLSANFELGEVVIMLQNIGSVPAKSIKLYAEEVRATPSTEMGSGSKIYEKLDGSTFSWEAGAVQLFPGAPMRVAVPLRGFKPEEVDAIMHKRETLYVFGRIEYEDGFGNPDSTVFAFEYNPPQRDGWTAHSDLSQFFKRK